MSEDNVKALYSYLMQCEKCDSVALWIELDGPAETNPDVVRVVCSECGETVIEVKGAEDAGDSTTTG